MKFSIFMVVKPVLYKEIMKRAEKATKELFKGRNNYYQVLLDTEK